MIQGDPKNAFFPAGTNEQIEVSLAPSHRQRPTVSEAASERWSRDSRTLEDHVVCDRPQQCGRSGQDQTPEERVLFDAPVIFFFAEGWKWAHPRSLCQMLDRTQWRCQSGWIFQNGGSTTSGDCWIEQVMRPKYIDCGHKRNERTLGKEERSLCGLQENHGHGRLRRRCPELGAPHRR